MPKMLKPFQYGEYMQPTYKKANNGANRLSDLVKPLSYKLFFNTDFKNFVYEGTEEIAISIPKPLTLRKIGPMQYTSSSRFQIPFLERNVELAMMRSSVFCSDIFMSPLKLAFLLKKFSTFAYCFLLLHIERFSM